MAGLPTDDMLVYDGACPVCRQYVAWASLREAYPEIRLIDARTEPDLVAALRTRNIEINDTYMLQLDGERYLGAAAMARISALMEPETLVQRVLKQVTRSERLMRPVYPWLVRARKALLWLIGRDQIR
ncbi:MAG: DCC1-like thiol-disulfide oxidoreductase family protein [Paracoccaceae bacterium]